MTRLLVSLVLAILFWLSYLYSVKITTLLLKSPLSAKADYSIVG